MMLMIKYLSSHVDLNTGENKHTMVVGRIDQDEGIEVDLDPIAYLQLGQAAHQLMGAAPLPQDGPEQQSMFASAAKHAEQHLREVMKHPPQNENEQRLEAQLRAMEASMAEASTLPQEQSSPDDLLRSVGWFDREEEDADPPKDALAELMEETPDPGEDYPEDDGVEAI